MKTLELEEIRLEQQMLKKKQDALIEKEKEINKNIRAAMELTADEALLKDETSDVELNYVLAYYDGYKDGFNAAMGVIIDSLASGYRDIPMTEEELYTIAELGRFQERAWLKDFKQKDVARKSGWEQDYFQSIPIWKRKEEKKNNES